MLKRQIHTASLFRSRRDLCEREDHSYYPSIAALLEELGVSLGSVA